MGHGLSTHEWVLIFVSFGAALGAILSGVAAVASVRHALRIRLAVTLRARERAHKTEFRTYIVNHGRPTYIRHLAIVARRSRPFARWKEIYAESPSHPTLLEREAEFSMYRGLPLEHDPERGSEFLFGKLAEMRFPKGSTVEISGTVRLTTGRTFRSPRGWKGKVR